MIKPDDAHVRKVWRDRVMPELRVPCSLHLSMRHLDDDDYGCCFRDRAGRWHVCIRPGLPYCTAIDTLIHELAHLDGIMAESMKHDDHGPLWGVAYSHWYQIIMRTA